MVNLKIDGKDVQVAEGATILEAAASIGIEIPTMCYLKKVSPTGACRVCLVAVAGCDNPVTACNTPVTEGMEVTTTSPELERQRAEMVKLLLVNHPLDCPVCDSAGECDLQDMVYAMEITQQLYQAEDVAHETIEDWPLIQHVPSRCILCEKCIKVGYETTGIGDFELKERGDRAYIDRHADADPDAYIEGNAVQVCPVGAMISKLFKHKARVWTLDKVASVGFAAGAHEEVELNVRDNKLYRITSQDEGTANAGTLSFDSCFGYGFVGSEKRLQKPLQGRGHAQQEVEWDQALDGVVTKAKQYGGQAIAALGSARLTLEEAYQLQKLVRAGWGSNSIDSEERYGYLRAQKSLQASMGVWGPTASIDSIANAGAILVVGADLSAEAPMVNLKVQQAARKRDAKLMVANPQQIRLNGLSRVFLQCRPGSEIVLVNALSKCLLDAGAADEQWLKDNVANSNKAKKSLKGATLAKAEEVTGVKASLIQEAAEYLAETKDVAIVYGRQAQRHPQAEELLTALANLAFISGALQGANGGIFALSERANSQGVLDMGLCPEWLPGYHAVDQGQCFSDLWQGQQWPATGANAEETLSGIEQGQIKFLYLVAANPLVTYPQAERWRQALAQLDFLVVQDILASELTRMADVVLPGSSFAEKGGTVIATDGTAGCYQPALQPPGVAWQDLDVLVELSRRSGLKGGQSAPEVLQEVCRLVPGYDPVSGQSRRWQQPVRRQKMAASDGYQFVSVKTSAPQACDLMLIVGTNHAHTGVTSTYADGPLAMVPTGYVALSPADAQKYGVTEGDQVELRTESGQVKAPVRLSQRMVSGVIFAPYHFADMPIQSLMPGNTTMAPVTMQKV